MSEKEILVKENKELKEDNEICSELLDKYMCRQRIIENIFKLNDLKFLKCVYVYTKKLAE